MDMHKEKEKHEIEDKRRRIQESIAKIKKDREDSLKQAQELIKRGSRAQGY